MKDVRTGWPYRLRSFLQRARSLPVVAAMKAAGMHVHWGTLVQTTELPWMVGQWLTLGRRAQLCRGAALAIGPNGSLDIGADTAIGRFNSICALGMLHIGAGCLFSEWVHVSDAEHIIQPGISPVYSGLKFKAPVHISRYCMIGRLVTILPGTILGRGCVVGANSVVNGYWPAGSVIADTPAKLIRTINACDTSS